MRRLRRQKYRGLLSFHGRYQDKHTRLGSQCRALRCEILEPRRLLSGVTLITHGFNSGVDDWVSAMADAIAARSGQTSDQPRYRVEVTDPGHDGGPLSVVNTSRSGPAPTDYSGETDIVILLDWSDVAGKLSFGVGYYRSTVDVAAAVAEKLLAPNFLVDLLTPLAELPFHLIGHSRGASLVGELAKDLGEQGVWVDQVTTLDPHPVDGVREPWLFNYDFGDAPMTSWENVVFWDNYWRTAGSSLLDFTGESIANVYDLQLNETVLSSGGYPLEHSDVHLWYHGTIDTSPTASDGSYIVPTSWYGGVHPARDATGFYYSRLANGTREIAGLSVELGGTANRTDIDWSAAEWPNVLELTVGGSNLEFVSGDPIPVSYYYQDFDCGATISFSLDLDQNPYSQNAVGEWNEEVEATGVAPVQCSTSLSFGGVPIGTYYVTAKITDPGGHTRYAYSPDSVTIVMPDHTTHTWDGGGGDNKWSTAANWVGDVAPMAGDNLVFPEGAARLENMNDFPATTVFGSITVSGSGYRLHTGDSLSTSVQVQTGAQLEMDKIISGALTIGAGAKVTISPISSGTSEISPAKSIAQPVVAGSPALKQPVMAFQLAAYDAILPKDKHFTSDRNRTGRNDANWVNKLVQEQVPKKEPGKNRMFHQALDSIFSGFDAFEL
jgi:pimeloyl-ACP methyl ester carboxylesterase